MLGSYKVVENVSLYSLSMHTHTHKKKHTSAYPCITLQQHNLFSWCKEQHCSYMCVLNDPLCDHNNKKQNSLLWKRNIQVIQYLVFEMIREYFLDPGQIEKVLVLTLQAMTNDSNLNMGNNIRMRDRQFFNMFWLKILKNQKKCQSNVSNAVFTNNIYL